MKNPPPPTWRVPSCVPPERSTTRARGSFRRLGELLALLILMSPGLTAAAPLAARKTNALTEPAALFTLRPLDLLAAFPQPPRFESILFPASDPVSRITHLAVSDGRLWMAARPRGETNLPPGEGRLWTFSPAWNQIEAVRGALANDSIRDLRARKDGVWVTVEGGVVVLDPQTFVFDPFSSAQGITARQLTGFAATETGLFTLSETGLLFELRPDGRAWRRVDPPAPAIDPRDPVRWRRTAGSAEWILALGGSGAEMAVRQVGTPDWALVREDSLTLIPRVARPEWTAVAGDHGGGFWLGSDTGLHFLVAETGSMEHHLAPLRPQIPGGWGRTFGPHFKPSAGLLAEITTRQVDEIRKRMRERARLARVAKELRVKLDPLTPTSRIPGAVQAMVEDGAFLWVATSDPLAANRSRVLLFHAQSRKWLGWFSVSRPVTALAVDATHVYLGLDIEPVPNGVPVLRVEKAAYRSTPEIRRTADPVAPAELGPKLAALPTKERAVFAFFSGDPQMVVDLLADVPKPDAEMLFLLAFAHDPVGLDQPARHEEYLDALANGFPESPFTLATAGLRQPRTAPPRITPRDMGAPVPAPTPTPTPAESASSILARRDLNRDGKLNPIEFRLWRGPKAEFQRYDRNGDGSLDLTEVNALLSE